MKIVPTAPLLHDNHAHNGRLKRFHQQEIIADTQSDWQPAIITADDDQSSVGIVVTATQAFKDNDQAVAMDRSNDWKVIQTDDIVQSPVLQVQSQFSVDEVTGEESERPHYEPWVQRERIVSSTAKPVATTTQRYNKSYRRPYSAARREEQKLAELQQSNENGDTAANLKNILKQSGGLSLSEILQQQNLSLDDLLKGKQTALQALKNTAPPPSVSDAKEVNAMKSTTRRLPALQQLNVNKPRRNFFNGTTRTATYQPTATPLQDASESEEDSDISSEQRKTASTIPTFLAKASSIYADEPNEPSGVRRFPSSSRGKPIKEVVSAIRPDLNNSNSRKRLPSLKLLQSKQQSSTTAETKPEVNQSDANENTNDSDSEAIGGDKQIQNDTITKEKVNAVTVAPNDVENVAISSTTESSRANLRERLAFRPPRLRNAPASSQSLSIPSSTTSSTEMPPTQSTIEITPSKEPASSEETLPYTILMITTPANDQLKPNEPTNNDNLNLKLNETAPEYNLVDLEDESKSKEVTSLEELFFADNMDSDMSSNSEMDTEFVHASSTSRSDKVFKSDKPNSQKMFSSNLVNIFKKTLAKLDVTERNPSLFTDITSRIVDDKTELMDLLSDRRSGARLVKVLKQRNMTFDELLDHRQRGSSQLHLAEIFNNRTKGVALATSTQPTQPDVKSASKLDIVTAFKTFPEFDLDSVKSVNPDEIKTDSQGSSYFTSIINIRPTAEVIKEARAIRKPFVIKLADSATRHGIPTQHNWNTDLTDTSSPRIEQNFLESASNSGISIFASHHASSIQRPSTGDNTNINGFVDISQQNRNDALARSYDPLDLELTGHGYKRNSVLIENAQMPIGVRSAIVASASIVLISLTIFFVIFLVCRWRQRRKRKICYSDRFQAIRGRLPILSSRDASPTKNSRSTSPPIAYLPSSGSRRSSKLNTMDPNSPEVQDYLYDAMRKPFQ